MQTYLIANWKAHKTKHAAQQWCTELSARYPIPPVRVIVAPPFPLLSLVRATLPQVWSIAGQDVSQFAQGAYTGAVTADHLVDMGAQYVVVGHSERRHYFHETSADVAGKVERAQEAGLTPVICIDTPYLDEQLAALASQDLSKGIFAYEPLASIGTGNRTDAGTVRSVVDAIRQRTGAETPVLYGGSVDASSVAEYFTVCSGALVGGASLEPSSFSELIAVLK